MMRHLAHGTRQMHRGSMSGTGSSHYVAGVDEVGRGPLAGPVVTAAVILDAANMPMGLADSKTLSQAQREIAYNDIMAKALAVSFASASAATIDRLNIRAATLWAMARAVRGLALAPSLVLVDGRDGIDVAMPCRAIIKGDASEPAIAAASIVAKITRDRLMTRLGEAWPVYGFACHVGYGTPVHRAAILEHGPCPEHRHSFAPVKNLWQRG
jgi:ribonuclease HII